MSVWDKGYQIHQILSKHSDGMTVKDIGAYLQRNTVDVYSEPTIRNILMGLRKLGLVYRRKKEDGVLAWYYFARKTEISNS